MSEEIASAAKLSVRSACRDDAAELCEILNEIIEIGGTTAHQTQVSEDWIIERFFTRETNISCLIAVDETDTPMGFQTLDWYSKLPDDWADISTFSRVTGKIRGVGTVLFAETLNVAKKSDVVAINATIRADNEGGLAYYDKMGFETYHVHKDILLSDGTQVDRIAKRHTID